MGEEEDFGVSADLGPPTHYRTGFDETGTPIATALTGDEPKGQIAGKLPKGWDNLFWTWEPAYDPQGAWVQRVDAKREALWAEAKAERTADPETPLSTFWGTVQIDPASLASMRARAQRLLLPNPPATIVWTMADNADVTFTPDEFLEMLADVEDHLHLVHMRSQGIREQIFDPRKDTLEALASISAQI